MVSTYQFEAFLFFLRVQKSNKGFCQLKKDRKL